VNQDVAIRFIGLGADWWLVIVTATLAIATFGLAVVTALLVYIGRIQVLELRHEAKQERTLEYCNRYDCDPILDGALRRLGEARETGKLIKNYNITADVATVLNYLDGLATGIAQELYIEELAKDHMEHVFLKHVEQYLSKDSPDLGAFRDHYKLLLKLHAKWTGVDEVKVSYKGRNRGAPR